MVWSTGELVVVVWYCDGGGVDLNCGLKLTHANTLLSTLFSLLF